MSTEVKIKNMVCQRCIAAVSDLFREQSIPVESIDLGLVKLQKPLEKDQKNNLSSALESLGFELLEDKSAQLISRIKALIIQEIHQENPERKENFSSLISQNLNHDYSHLSRLFSTVEGITIEKFITKQKIEKVKELLSYGELSLSEISFLMNYSSVAYLSSQFKKETGMTPSAFKTLKSNQRNPLDKV